MSGQIACLDKKDRQDLFMWVSFLKIPFCMILSRKRTRFSLTSFLLWLSGGALLFSFGFFLLCRLDFNARVSRREWFLPAEQPLVMPPLSGCFDRYEESHPYKNGRRGYKNHLVAGIPLWEENTCYEFAYLLQSNTMHPTEFHTFWSSQTSVFGEKQLAAIQSFAATQDTNSSMTLWIHSDDESALLASPFWDKAKAQVLDRLHHQLVNTITNGTQFERFPPYDHLVRLVVLYLRGGVWFDLNTIFTRNIAPLLDHEWVAQGSCLTSLTGNPFTGGLFHFTKHSPYMCELVSAAASLIRQNDDSTTHAMRSSEMLGAELFQQVYRQLLHYGITPWTVLPWCFTDPSRCKSENSLPSPFGSKRFNQTQLRQIFAYHWHDAWDARDHPQSISQYLQGVHRSRLARI